MAVFEYKCNKCGTIIEVLTGMTQTDDDTTKCTECDGTITKLVSTNSKPIIN